MVRTSQVHGGTASTRDCAAAKSPAAARDGDAAMRPATTTLSMASGPQHVAIARERLAGVVDVLETPWQITRSNDGGAARARAGRAESP